MENLFKKKKNHSGGKAQKQIVAHPKRKEHFFSSLTKIQSATTHYINKYIIADYF